MAKIRKAQIFIGKEKLLAAHLFFVPNPAESQKLSSKYLDIIFPGLPQSPCFHRLENLATEDRSILYIHFYGSWYSGGKFTPASAAETVNEALELCRIGTTTDEYTDQTIEIRPQIVTLIGNSFGGHFVYQNNNNEIPHQTVLISPLLAVSPKGLSDISKTTLEQISRDLESFKKTLRFAYRGIDDPSWNNFVNSSLSTELDKKPSIKIILGEMDRLITPSYVSDSLKDLCEPAISAYPCGHDFYELYGRYIENSSSK